MIFMRLISTLASAGGRSAVTSTISTPADPAHFRPGRVKAAISSLQRRREAGSGGRRRRPAAIRASDGRPWHAHVIGDQLQAARRGSARSHRAAGMQSGSRTAERARLAHRPAACTRLALRARSRHRDRRQQRAACRDGAARRTASSARRALDDAAEIHHRDAVGDVLHHREVVRDEDIGEPEPPLQVAQQIEDLRADRDVERRDRLVADDQLRLDRERARDGDALALAAGEFVRIARVRSAARGRRVAAAPRRARARRRPATRSCSAQRLGQDLRRRSCAD